MKKYQSRKNGNKKLNLWKILLLIFFIFSFHIVSYSKSIQSEIADNVIRLHVIANSDSKEDQDIKYVIRDAVLKHMNSALQSSTNISDSRKILNENLPKIEDIANSVLDSKGYSYDAKVSFDTSFFQAKNYGDITLPSGKYEAIKIVLGDGKGKNWWCVMFPPICFTDITTGIVPDSSKLQLQTSLSDDSYSLITADADVEFRFKLVDFINSIL